MCDMVGRLNLSNGKIMKANTKIVMIKQGVAVTENLLQQTEFFAKNFHRRMKVCQICKS